MLEAEVTGRIGGGGAQELGAPGPLVLFLDRPGGFGERGQRPEKALVRRVVPGDRTLAAPAGTTQGVEPAVVPRAGIRIGLDRMVGVERQQ